MDLVWAVDFGGTGVKLGLVDREGRIHARGGFPTKEASDPVSWIRRVCRELRGLKPGPTVPGDVRIAGVGVGAPGFMDFERGFVHTLVNVRGWDGVPLRDELVRHLGVPAVIDNDANAMALGEVRHGAGRGRRNVVFATLGTGIGGGLYLNGQIYRGAYSMAGEIGHVSIDWEGRTTRQGQGGVEAYVGNRPFVQYAVDRIRAGEASRMADLHGGRLENLTPKDISDAADAGDALALACFEYMADALGAALASLTYVLQPEVFVVGGGVASAGAKLFDPLIRELRARLDPLFAERVAVVPAQLGPDAGLIGAGELVWNAGGTPV